MFVKLSSVLMVFYASAHSLSVQRRELDECAPLHLIHLAGVTDIGFGIVGRPLAAALNSTIPGTTSYAIPYNTSPKTRFTIKPGAQTTEAYLQQQTAKCPNQRFVLSGYSKGAFVLHRLNLSEDTKSRVMSVLVFGDPLRNMVEPWPITSPSVNLDPKSAHSPQNVASFCNGGDGVCAPPGHDLASHFQYPHDGSIGVAVDFVNANFQNVTAQVQT